jgi:ribosomal protein L1
LVADPAKRAKELASGKTSVRSEKKAPLVHTTIGKISMDADAIEANIRALINAAGQTKVLKAVICTSMSPGVKIAL